MTFEQWLQSRLTSHGYSPGPIDGDIAWKTQAAISAFQKARALPETGKADEATVAALRATSVGAPIVLPPELKAPTTAQKSYPRQPDVEKVYGKVGTNQTTIDVPFALRLAWNPKITTQRMTVHEKVADDFAAVLRSVQSAYSPADISRLGFDLFGGSLNVRRMRGGTAWSMHSWGIAADFDPARNPLKGDHRTAFFARPECADYVKCWTKPGFTSLGVSRDFDWMHFQAARL